MRKLVYFLIGIMLFISGITAANANDVEANNEQADSKKLIVQLLSIREKMHKADSPLFFMQIDVVSSTMTVYRLVEKIGEEFSLEEISTHLVGTPKAKQYPKGFGFIASIEKAPIWAPTPETVKEFKKRGTDLEKFRNAQGTIIIPAGHSLNYMGPIKMRVRFLEKQATAKLNRDVYRIHGTLKKDVSKLGTRCSGGCIRTKNEELFRLYNLMKSGFIAIEYV